MLARHTYFALRACNAGWPVARPRCAFSAVRAHTRAAESLFASRGRRPTPPPPRRRLGAASEPFARCAAAARARTGAQPAVACPHPPLTLAVSTRAGSTLRIATRADSVGATAHMAGKAAAAVGAGCAASSCPLGGLVGGRGPMRSFFCCYCSRWGARANVRCTPVPAGGSVRAVGDVAEYSRYVGSPECLRVA